MDRILVIRGGAIGDFVLTLPALKVLRDRYPDSHIEILGYKHIIALAENRYYANATRSIEYAALSSFFSRNGLLPEELAAYFSSFDQIISYLFDPDEIFATNLQRAGVRNYVASAGKLSGRSHATEQLAEPLVALGLSLEDRAAKLYPSSNDQEAAAALLPGTDKRLIAVHPGSGSPGKNWPRERWSALARDILNSDRDTHFVVIAGEAEERSMTELRQEWERLPVTYVLNQPLPVVAAVLARCAVFLGHDSGISHIAAAVGLPTILIFGPTDPTVWAPMNSKVAVVRAPEGILERVSVGDIKAAVAAWL